MKNKDTKFLEEAYEQVQVNQQSQQDPQLGTNLQRRDTGNRLMNFLNNVKEWAYQPDMQKYKQFLANVSSVLQKGIDDNTYDQAIRTLSQIAVDPQVAQGKREQVQGFLDSVGIKM